MSNKSMSVKYLDKGHHLFHWANEVEAVCPECKGVGLVKGNSHYKDWTATYMCQSCSLSLKTERDEWHGPVLGMGRRPCSSCGHKWVTVEVNFVDLQSVKKNTAGSRCNNCNALNEVKLEFFRTEPIDHAIEPFFGLELSLKERTRYGVVWAYNASHLEELKKYIAAQLREGSGSKWSYFTRLPKWIKLAKNRKLVLKAINKLEKQLITNHST